jgi:hypothetical protein
MGALSEEDKKKLKRFSFYLQTTSAADGLDWTQYVYDYNDMDSAYGPHPKVDLTKFMTEIELIENIFEKAIENYDIEDLIYSVEGSTGSANIEVVFNPEDLHLDISIDIYYLEVFETEKTVTFEELSTIENGPYTFQRYDYLKNFGDPTFIQECEKEYGKEFEISYDGYGDSGQLSTDILNQKLEYAIYELIDVYHSGWEINEGSTGTIYINFEKQTITIYHSQNSEDAIHKELVTIDLLEL